MAECGSLPRVTVHRILMVRKHTCFGAETSGDVLLYDIHGAIAIQGGITGSRGHAGDNAGENTILFFVGWT